MDYFHSRPLESPNFPPSGLSISQVCYCFSALHWSAPSGSHAQINSHSRPHHGPLRWVLTLFFFPRQSSDKRTLAQRPGSVRTTSQRPMFTADGPWLRAGPHLLRSSSRGTAEEPESLYPREVAHSKEETVVCQRICTVSR